LSLSEIHASVNMTSVEVKEDNQGSSDF